MYSVLRFIPKNHLSFLFGKLSLLKLPAPINQSIINSFCRYYQVNLSEAEKQTSEFQSLGDFFVRKLKDGARPIGDGVVSPVDGQISEFGQINDGRLIQAKGRYYSLLELIRNETISSLFSNGYFLTFYLAPKDYHHIHSPVDGQITDSLHIPGNLWPVNSWSLSNIKDLFVVNERIICVIRFKTGTLAVVMVGATNVGSIRLSFDKLIGNTGYLLYPHKRSIVHQSYLPHISIAKGDLMGTFHLGSTVILLFSPSSFLPSTELAHGSIKYGVNIGS